MADHNQTLLNMIDIMVPFVRLTEAAASILLQRGNTAVLCPDCTGLGSGDPLCLCKVDVQIYQHRKLPQSETV